MQPDFATCLMVNTRMAARAVTRRYDALLRPHALTAAQFALLGGMVRGRGETVTELADRNGIERTGLTRTLNLLEKRGLIASRPADKGNARICDLTEAGAALVAELVPIWVAAQSEMRELLSADDFSTTFAVLKRLSRV